MAPAIPPPPSVVLVSVLGGTNHTRGDAVAVRSPLSPRNSFISRVVAVTGDWVRLPALPAGTKAQPSPVLELASRLEVQSLNEPGQFVHVPPGHCWLQPDDFEAASVDHVFGLIPLALIEGRAAAVI